MKMAEDDIKNAGNKICSQMALVLKIKQPNKEG